MNIEHDYLRLLNDILINGIHKQTRNGETISVFGRQIRHDMSKGFPLITTKKMYWKGIVTELLWFLRGETNIKYLVDNDCHIWDGDCFANYMKEWSKCVPGDGKFKEGEFNSSQPYEASNFTKEEFINKIKTDDEFANKWGELGPVYGKQWRRWSTYPDINGEYETNPIDQIANLINNLKTNPDSRRLMVNAWNPSDLHDMVLPPCHYGFQVYTRELSLEEIINQMRELNKGITKNGREMDDDELRDMFKAPLFKEKIINTLNIPTRAISLMWQQRSVDTFLGLPFNIASYALLLEIIAKEVNMVPDELIGNLGDVHLYKNHVEQAKEQLTREPYPLPKLGFLRTPGVTITNNGWEIIDNLNLFSKDSFQLLNYQSHPTIKAPLSN